MQAGLAHSMPSASGPHSVRAFKTVTCTYAWSAWAASPTMRSSKCWAYPLPNLVHVVWCDTWLQGYAGMTQRVSTGTNAGSTVWGAHPLPQNREVTMTGSGDGTLSLWKYQYPDQRKIKVCWPCWLCWG